MYLNLGVQIRSPHTVPMTPFQVISKRYEKGSVIITTNKTFEQWTDIFSDAVLSSVIIDRVVHNSVVIKINGKSYHKKDIKKKGSKA